MFINHMPLIVALSYTVLQLGMYFALRMRDHQHLLLGFGAGSMVGVAIFALLPDAMDNGPHWGGGDGPHVAPYVACGFVAYMLLERFFLAHFHRADGCESDRHDGRFGAAAIIVHGAIDGFAIMMSFRAGEAIGYSVAISILVHQFSDAMNVTTMVMRDADRETLDGRRIFYKRYRALNLWISGLFIAVIAGMLSGLWIWTSWFELRPIFAVLAGIFLYVGAADLIPESHHRHPTIWTTMATIVGMLVIYGVTTLGE